jgi:hypothetical protein
MKRYPVALLASLAFCVVPSALTAASKPSRASFCKSYGCIQIGKETRAEYTEYTYRLSTNKNATVKFRLLNTFKGPGEYVDHAELYVVGTAALTKRFGFNRLAMALLYATAGKRVTYSAASMFEFCGGYDSRDVLKPFPVEDITKEPDYWYYLTCTQSGERLYLPRSSVTLSIVRSRPER